VSEGTHPNSRRNFLKSSLIAISTATLPASAPAAVVASATPAAQHFFNEPERHFLEAAVDRLIPSDDSCTGPLKRE
jgi:hypothetical protein